MISRVLLVANEYPPEKTAGTAMSTQFLAEELASRGRSVTVVVNTQRVAPLRERVRGVDVVRIRPVPLPFTRMVQRSVVLSGIAGRLRPDVIQGQSLSCGALAVWAGGRLRAPSVVYVQGLDLYESSRAARETYIRWTLTRSDGVVAVTADLRDRAVALSGRTAEVIPHGLRYREAHGTDRIAARQALGLPVRDGIMLFVGRLIPIKGVEFLLRAMPALTAAHPRLRLILVGEGPHRAVLERLAEGMGLRNSVTFAGERSHEDVIRFMRAADLFVLPSLIESFGMVLVEAMSCGLPVVASRVMGIPSVVGDGENGFLVPPGNPHVLGHRLRALLDDPDLRARLGAANIRKAAGFAMPVIADRFLEMWGRVINERGHRRA